MLSDKLNCMNFGRRLNIIKSKDERLEVQLSAVRSNEASLHSVVDGTAGIVGSPVVEPQSEPLSSNALSSGDVVEVPGVEVSNSSSVVSTTVTTSHPLSTLFVFTLPRNVSAGSQV